MYCFLSLAERKVRNTGAYLREEMMEDVGSNVMMNLVEDAIVSVNCGKSSPEVAPFLCMKSIIRQI